MGLREIEQKIMKNKTIEATTSTVAIGMVSSISFSIIDSIFFLFIEDNLKDFWKKRELTEDIIPIVNGGISSSISILIAVLLENYLEKHYEMFKHPLIEASGMIIGTIIILFTYKLFVLENKPILSALHEIKGVKDNSKYHYAKYGDNVTNQNENTNQRENTNPHQNV
jgi:hypothetical protein